VLVTERGQVFFEASHEVGDLGGVLGFVGEVRDFVRVGLQVEELRLVDVRVSAP